MVLNNNCKKKKYGEKYIKNMDISPEINESIIEIINDNRNSSILANKYVDVNGKLLVNDEYLTPRQILETFPYFNQFIEEI